MMGRTSAASWAAAVAWLSVTGVFTLPPNVKSDRASASDWSAARWYPDAEDIAAVERFKRQDPAEEEQKYCDFGSTDDKHLCGWSNRNGSMLTWQQGSGTIANWLGGPPRDAGSNDEKGGYMFFDTSLVTIGPTPDSRMGHSAYLDSWVRGPAGPEGVCVSFNYWVEGLSAAGLRMSLMPMEDDPGVGGERVLWSTKDPTDRSWHEADVLFTFNGDHRIIFEGLARDINDAYRKFRGFNAIDNVAFKAGLDCKGHCTFEGGFCGWSNVEEDDFDWSLGRGSRNPSTGPATDGTSFKHGGAEGGYAFIDSGFPRRPGDVARLMGPDFDSTGSDSPICLRFWTHMYGNGIGTLAVLLREGDRDRYLWRLSGESGNAWYQAEVPISSPNSFRIIIEGQVGKNNLGDIALDDISFTRGSCPTQPQIAASMPGDCTFEVDECAWSNAAQRERVDDIDWERVSGQATRTSTHDHTLGYEKGFLMTLARNNVQRPGSRAWFSSPHLMGGETPRCLSFWFVLNEPFIDNTGPSLGALAVYTRSMDKNGHSVATPLWRLYNHQGPEWRYAQVPLPEQNYTVIMEGTWGSSRANGFVGLDDITFFDGACSTMPSSAQVRLGECRFERDTCDWYNDTVDKSHAAWRLATVSRRPANLPDKTFGAPEGYIYFDLFNQALGSNTARLVSPTIPGLEGSEERQLCFTFWFAAFGAGDSAELRVLRQDNSTSGAGDEAPEKIWVLEAQTVDTARASWSPAQVTVEAGSDFRVILEGQAVNGGFAVDDLTFSLGQCETRPKIAVPKVPEES